MVVICRDEAVPRLYNPNRYTKFVNIIDECFKKLAKFYIIS